MGYSITSHIPNHDLISDIIPNILDKNKKNVMINSDGGNLVLDPNDYFKFCKEYFYMYFEKGMEQGALSFPYVDENVYLTDSELKYPVYEILLTMKNWCNTNQEKGIVRGFVIYGYNLDSHLTFLRYPDTVYQYFTRVKDCNEILVCNPLEKVILLIKTIENIDRSVKDEMSLPVSYLTKFAVIHNENLTNSGFNVINFLATDAAVDCNLLKCNSCKNQVIPIASLITPTKWKEWWNINKTKYCNKNFSIKKSDTSHVDVFASVLVFLAQENSNCYFRKMLPSLTNIPENLIDNATILPD